jgi:hypothetical protein
MHIWIFELAHHVFFQSLVLVLVQVPARAITGQSFFTGEAIKRRGWSPSVATQFPLLDYHGSNRSN